MKSVEQRSQFCYLHEMKNGKLLSTKEIASMLHIPLVKIQRWVHQGKIPCRYKDGSCYFKEINIREWAREHDLIIYDLPEKKTEKAAAARIWNMTQAIENGGVFFEIEGQDIIQVFTNAVDCLPFSDEIKENILNELLNREEIASTGIGKGVAIPHPRRVLSLDLELPIVPVIFLKNPIDFNAVDGKPVFVLFFLFSPTTKIHLEVLCRLSFMLQSAEFMSELRKLSTKEDLLQLIKDTERALELDGV